MSRARCHAFKIPFKEQMLTKTYSVKMVQIHLQEETSRDYEKEKPSLFLKKFLSQSQSATPTSVPKKDKTNQFLA